MVIGGTVRVPRLDWKTLISARDDDRVRYARAK